MSPDEIIERFDLKKLPVEGGYFTPVYRGEHIITDPGGRQRNLGSSILYLITQESFSSLHLLDNLEIWHYCGGDEMQQLLLYPDGSGEVRSISLSSPVSIVPGGVWQGTRLVAGGSWGLCGVTMLAAYTQEDFHAPDPGELSSQYPRWREQISAMVGASHG